MLSYPHISIFPNKSICSGSSVYSWFQRVILTQKGSEPHFHMVLFRNFPYKAAVPNAVAMCI